ncbi:cobalamin-binding protein [Pseudomonas sp. JQ170]|uniref:cobalamin-binding protein n=1 Tax=unclassified Pseudomonas TaxID=196821 RepID=UPI0026512D55|nr:MULTISPECIES: cobalamin-binding protein [unclassified Pseudomonas]MDN7141523.1 cobalamin-binding protein [Pseudomonas sp. JQ170]WRO75575.1 cobalamin-binding protein [Pseudomonas sp. 170C]
MRGILLLALLVLAAPLAAASRVVSLAPSLSEIIVELQATDLLVGMLDGGDRPPALAAVPSVGRYGQIDMERLLSLKPDLLLLWPDSVPAAQRDQLKRLGIATYSAEPHDIDELIEQIEQIGVQLGRAEQGRLRAQQLRQQLQALRERYHREQPLRVFYQVWDKPLYTVGGGQIVSAALGVCGARNVFAGLKLPAPQVSLESVLLQDPEVILAPDQPQLDAWKAWPQVDAVRNGRLLQVPDKGLERPSGQMIEATARLCQLIETKAPVSR